MINKKKNTNLEDTRLIKQWNIYRKKIKIIKYGESGFKFSLKKYLYLMFDYDSKNISFQRKYLQKNKKKT